MSLYLRAGGEDGVLVLTGFGPFGDVLENPTSLIISELRKVAPSELCPWCPTQVIGVLEVSTVGVDRFIESVQPLFDGEASSRPLRCCIHLGVDSGATGFKLETCAFNNASFRIPDSTGRQVHNSPIDPAKPLESPLTTSFAVDEAVTALRSEGFNVSASGDAGRYLCNYVFYKSSQTAAGQSVIFIHVPPLTCIPLEEQVRFVRRAVLLLAAQAAGARR